MNARPKGKSKLKASSFAQSMDMVALHSVLQKAKGKEYGQEHQPARS
jgi:hypothetical protein